MERTRVFALYCMSSLSVGGPMANCRLFVLTPGPPFLEVLSSRRHLCDVFSAPIFLRGCLPPACPLQEWRNEGGVARYQNDLSATCSLRLNRIFTMTGVCVSSSSKSQLGTKRVNVRYWGRRPTEQPRCDDTRTRKRASYADFRPNENLIR